MIALSYLVKTSLWLLVLGGLWGGVRVSHATLTGAAPCPDAAGVPICYAVTLGYLAMLIALFPVPERVRIGLFYPAWALVALIAITGTGFELVAGNVCPRNDGGTPMCYFSLALCMAIIMLYAADRTFLRRGLTAT